MKGRSTAPFPVVIPFSRSPVKRRILDVAAHRAALLEILLVVILGLPEGFRGDDLGNDGLRELLLRGQAGDRGFRLGLLLRRVKEDRTAILRAPVRTLPIQLGGIVQLEKQVE